MSPRQNASNPINPHHHNLTPFLQPSNPSLYLIPMQPIFQMDLEIIDPHFRPRRVEFPGAIFAFDPGVVHVFHIIGGWGVGTHADGEVGDGADGGVAHCAFEGVGGVGLLEAGEGVVEPLWGFGLGRGEMVSSRGWKRREGRMGEGWDGRLSNVTVCMRE